MRKGILSLLLLLLCFAHTSFGQDTLLLTNGKYRVLRGVVVYYDYEDVYYQNEKQKEKMQLYLERYAQKHGEIEKARQAERKEKLQQKLELRKERIAEAKHLLEQGLTEREQSNFPPDQLEQWKSRQEANIKEMEQRFRLDSTVMVQLIETRAQRKENRIRRRFTKSVPRTLVFSILHPDGTEEVVYNADTLGFLMDGTTDVEYNVAEMRLYIKGRQDGRKHSFHDVYIGAGVGLISGLAFTYTLDMFYAPIPPAICIAVIAGLNNFKPSPKLELSKALLESDPYMDGYIRSAKGRKIAAFTIGAVGGLGIGITAAVLTSPLLQK